MSQMSSNHHLSIMYLIIYLRVPKLQNLEGKKIQIYKYIHIIHTGCAIFYAYSY